MGTAFGGALFVALAFFIDAEYTEMRNGIFGAVAFRLTISRGKTGAQKKFF